MKSVFGITGTKKNKKNEQGYLHVIKMINYSLKVRLEFECGSRRSPLAISADAAGGKTVRWAQVGRRAGAGSVRKDWHVDDGEAGFWFT